MSLNREKVQMVGLYNGDIRYVYKVVQSNDAGI